MKTIIVKFKNDMVEEFEYVDVVKTENEIQLFDVSSVTNVLNINHLVAIINLNEILFIRIKQ